MAWSDSTGYALQQVVACPPSPVTLEAIALRISRTRISLALLAAVACLLCAENFSSADARYTITVLEPLPGGVYSQAVGLNSAGVAVGNTIYTGGATSQSATRWIAGAPQSIDLDHLIPNAINNNGWIAGQIGNTLIGVLLAGSESQVLNPINGYSMSNAVDINSAGTVVGGSSRPNGLGQYNTKATAWRDNTIIELACLPGRPLGEAGAINESGQIVGRALSNPATGDLLPVRWTTTNHATPLPIVSGGTWGAASDINDLGEVVGLSEIPGGGTLAVRWTTDNKLCKLNTLPGQFGSSALSINNLHQIAGFAYINDQGRTKRVGFIWTLDEGTLDLNRLLGEHPDWTITSAERINENGQILCRGYRQVGASVAQSSLLLTPIALVLPNENLQLRDDKNNSVVGIVCDNLRGMPLSILNTLVMTSEYFTGASDIKVLDLSHDKNGGSKDRHQQLNVGALKIDGSRLVYTPPDEFNFVQEPENLTDITKLATRTVWATIEFRRGGRQYKFLNVPLVLARPPVVLVHGINNTAAVWWDLMFAIATTNGIDMPFVLVDHSSILNGNGQVEVGASILSDRISGSLSKIRRGVPLSNGRAVFGVPIKSFADYDSYSRAGAFAIRRVDVLGWSYGGVITRWYIASDATQPSQPDHPTQTWYKRKYSNLTAPVSPTKYACDVRKFMTLGSMWRGVPLCNYVNEAHFSHGSYPAINGTSLFDAPLIKGDLLGATIGSFLKLRSILKTEVPSMEVMSIDSRWIRYLVYDQNGIPRPFNEWIAYASIGGDDNNYPLVAGLQPDPYKLLHSVQTQSWFPGLISEVREDSSDGYSDGIVPIWSALIPGSSHVVHSDHSSFSTNPETRELIIEFLHTPVVKVGSELNWIWRSTSTLTVDQGRQWSFVPSEMAPIGPDERNYYQQRNGIGRINPDWLALASQPDVGPNPMILYRDGAYLKVKITVSNKSSVPGSFVNLRIDKDYTKLGTDIYLENTATLGHLKHGRSMTLTLAFRADGGNDAIKPGRLIDLRIGVQHSRGTWLLRYNRLLVP